MTSLAAKIAAARVAAGIARRTGRGGGTSLPGNVLIALERDAINELSARLSRGSVVISATSGKTTTAAMIASVLGHADVSVLHNRAGANMAGGVASALLPAARAVGRIDGELGLFEIDEFWLDRITSAVGPRAVLPGTVFRTAALCLELQIPLAAVATGLGDVRAALGRAERILIGRRRAPGNADEEPGRSQRDPAHADA